MKLGGAYYCDDCGSEIRAGDVCSECRPGEGVEQVTYTFLAIEPEGGVTFEPTTDDKPWWKFW